jgi:hypothetical protein
MCTFSWSAALLWGPLNFLGVRRPQLKLITRLRLMPTFTIRGGITPPPYTPSSCAQRQRYLPATKEQEGNETCKVTDTVLQKLTFNIWTRLHVWTFIGSSSSICTTTLSWVSACSTAVEHSQQEGFTECRRQRHVQPPTWRRTRDLERSNFRHKRPPAPEATLANPAAAGGTMGEKWPREFCRKWRLPRHF